MSDPVVRRRIELERFGEAFLEHVVTPERLRATIERAASRPFEVGPIRPLPLAPVEVRGAGRLKSVEVVRREGAGTFRAEASLDAELVIEIASVENRYRGTVTVRLRLAAVFEAPLVLFVEVERLARGDVAVHLEGETPRAEILGILANVRGEVERQIAKVLRSQITSERGVAARRIDIAAKVDAAWGGSS